MANNETIIQLSKLSDAKSFNDTELIQKDAKEIFLELFDSLLSKIQNEPDNKISNYELTRNHNAILIDGGRGSGKTSFVLSMLKHIDINNIKNGNKVEIIGLMDPTIIENKEHILINIIAKITEKIDRDSVTDDDYNIWKKYLHKLAGGLSVLEGVGSRDGLRDEIWDEPELVLEQGLKNAKSGENLEYDFHVFIKESLRTLKKEAFVIFIDDIDTSLEKGLVILEVLRKYLTCEQLIVVLSGDIKLYSIIARQLQWKKIDSKGILKQYEIDCKETDENGVNYKDIITHLEDQYLTKIIKPQNRIVLKDLLHYKDKIKIDFNKKGENIEINKKDLVDFLKTKFCKDVFSPSYRDIKLFQDSLLRLPIRSFLQLMELWYQYYDLNDNSKESGKGNNNKRLDFIKNFQSMFIAYLKEDVESKDFTNMDDVVLNRFSVWLLEHSEYLSDLYLLLPDFISDEYTIDALFLAAVFVYYFRQRKEKVLEYFIIVGLVKKCYDELKEFKDVQKNKDDEDDIVNKLIVHLRLDTSESTVNIAKKGTSYFMGRATKPNPLSFAYIHINRENNKSHYGKNIFLDIILSYVRYAKADSSYLYGSFFPILGVISEILSIKTYKETENKAIKEEINNIFHVHSQPITFQSVFNIGSNKGMVEEEGEFDTEQIGKSKPDGELIDALIKWTDTLENLEVPTITMLYRIWTRFSSNADDITIEFKKRQTSFDKILHRYIIAFFNALLIETALNEKSTFISLKNPVASDNVFNEWFKKDGNKYIIPAIEEGTYGNENGNKKAKLNLFNFIYSCPLWGIYLDNIDNTSPSPSGDYYIEQQKYFYKEKDIESLRIFYGKLNIKDIAGNIKNIVTDQKKKIDFKTISYEEQKNVITNVANRIKNKKDLKSEDIKKYNNAIYALLNNMRYNTDLIVNYTNIPRKVVEKIIKEIYG